MAQQLSAFVFNSKTWVRVAFTVLSLGGVAHAQSDNLPVGNSHPAPTQQGNDYNFMAGGGG